MSDDGHYMAVGFSTGIITTLDIRTGGYVSSWKAYDSDILEVCSKFVEVHHSFLLSYYIQLKASYYNICLAELSISVCNSCVHLSWNPSFDRSSSGDIGVKLISG